MISEYIDDCFAPRLRSFGANDSQVGLVTTEVRTRLTSLLRHWNDADFTKTLLEVGMEEASGYAPDTADIAIRSLVVVAIRNSLLEDMGATRPYHKHFQTGHPPIVKDADMPTITSEAIRFFDSAYRRNSFASVKPDSLPDIFATLPQTYPVTWNIFRAASQLSGGERRIRPINSSPPDFDLHDSLSIRLGSHPTIGSGIDPRYDDPIINILSAVRTGSAGLVFFPRSSGLPATPRSCSEFLSSFCALDLASLPSTTAFHATRFASVAFSSDLHIIWTR